MDQQFKQILEQFRDSRINWTLYFLKLKSSNMQLPELKECQKFLDKYIWELQAGDDHGY